MSGSFKLGSPLGTVGRLVSDRQASVVGKLGRTSRMIPVKVSVKNRQTGVAQRYACRVLTHDLLTPMLLNMSLMSFLDAAEPSFGWNTKQIAVTVSLANGKKVTVRDVAVGQSSTFSSLMTSVFSQLWRNPFRRVRIERIDLDVAVEQVDRSAYLLRVLREMQEARPGETLGLRVVLRRFDKRDITIPVTFKLPEELAPGKYTIEIGGGDIYQPSLPAPRNLDEIIQLIGHWERADTLVVWMRLPRLDVRLKGKTMQKVPASVLGTLLPANRGGELALTQAIHRSTTKTDYVLSGKLSFRIEVKKGADK